MCSSSFLYAKGNRMGDIQEALITFRRLMEYKYNFVISHKKIAYHFGLTFEEKDFRHIAGLHYLNDIDIPRTPKTLFEKIENGKITDEYLNGSIYYIQIDESYARVKERIFGLKFLEQFLDNKNMICKYVKYKNLYSSIKADYFIKSTVNGMTAYIFLVKRNSKSDDYCICSFFIDPQNEYKGISVYWLYKSKTNLKDAAEEILYDRLNKDAVGQISKSES